MRITTVIKICTLIFFYRISANAQELVAYYKFDGTLLDETVNAYNLMASSGFTPAFVTGKEGAAISGFGISDFLHTTKNLSISGNDSRTFAAWVKTGADESESGTSRAILAHGANEIKAKFNLLISGPITRSDPRPVSSIGASPLNTDDWKHVVVTYTNNMATLYVDGKKEILSAGSNDFGAAGINTTLSPLYIGNDADSSGKSGFEGAIDDVRIYDKGLTAEQVLKLFNGIPLSLNELQSSKTQINAYPNPVKTLLSFDADDVAFVSVYDVHGKKITEYKTIKNGINLDTLTKGIYLLKYFSSDKEQLGITTIVKE